MRWADVNRPPGARGSSRAAGELRELQLKRRCAGWDSPARGRGPAAASKRRGRGKVVTKDSMDEVISKLDVTDSGREELRKSTPHNFIGVVPPLERHCYRLEHERGDHGCESIIPSVTETVR